jgi:peptidoglycan/LPS O-acetylase OafA/YrhL
MKVITDHQNNAFNLSRLLASVMVLYGHSLSVGPGLNPGSDIAYKIFGVHAASLAVKFFFVLSGMLVCTSLLKSNNWKNFLVHRAFRIYPGLICALLFVVLVVAPIVGDVNFVHFITSKEAFSYCIKNLLFKTFGVDVSLPGVSVGKWTNMNIPLWTLAPEVGCYLFMLSVFMLTLGNRIALSAVALIVIIDCIIPIRFLLVFLPPGNDDFSFLPLFFAIGVLLSLYRKEFNISLVYIFIFGFLAFMFKGTYMGIVAKYLALIFMVLWFFTLPIICKYEINHDLSYGMYIYGWPIQMLVLYFFGDVHGYLHFFLPLAIAIPMAYISWRFIEKPFIEVGRVFSKKISPNN